ncbi:alpha/beta hydrolase-fold protein [Nocardioides sp.]|uniref:alpha/beta hydrolase-fold protein n=1 Tax=Nocardioides sp. TaxID=35761 RepID=UPI0035198E50
MTGAVAATAGLAAAGAGIATGLLPGRATALHHLGIDGADGVAPDVAPGPVTSGVLVSAARRGARCGWSVARPPGAARELPVVVVLHGRGGDHTSAFARDYMALDRFLAAAVDDGVPPFALASIDGGDRYWHARADGDDPARMVVEEFLPLLRRQGLDVGRLALAGWSMGGFGALHISSLLTGGAASEPVGLRAVAALSPALWHDVGDTTRGAFDSAEDLAAVTPFGRQETLRGLAVRIDCGLGDPFCAAAQDYVDGFARRPRGSFELGDHDRGYWRRMARPQLAFLGRALAG